LVLDYFDTERILREIQQGLKLLIFKFDYRKYLKFKYLTPEEFPTDGNPIWYKEDKKTFTSEGAEFCIDFVIECAIQLQEFDFEIDILV
jgi:hypothetical protein